MFLFTEISIVREIKYSPFQKGVRLSYFVGEANSNLKHRAEPSDKHLWKAEPLDELRLKGCSSSVTVTNINKMGVCSVLHGVCTQLSVPSLITNTEGIDRTPRPSNPLCEAYHLWNIYISNILSPQKSMAWKAKVLHGFTALPVQLLQ